MPELEVFIDKIHRERQRLDTISRWHVKAFEEAGIELPWSPDDGYINVNVSNYNKETKSYEFDLEASRKKIAAIAKFAIKQPGITVTKRFGSIEFEVKVTLATLDEYDHISITYYVKREAVCVKKVVGTEEVPERVYPAHTKEVVEWECEDVSLLKIASEA